MADGKRANAVCRGCQRLSPCLEVRPGDWLCAACNRDDPAHLEVAAETDSLLDDIRREIEARYPRSPPSFDVTVRRTANHVVSVHISLPEGSMLVGCHKGGSDGWAAAPENLALLTRTIGEAMARAAGLPGATPASLWQAAKSRLLIAGQLFEREGEPD